MLTIPAALSKNSDYEPLRAKTEGNRWGETVDLRSDELTTEMLDAILSAAREAKGVTHAQRTARVIEAIVAAKAGDTKKAVPSLPAFPEMLIAYLRSVLDRGWVYERRVDGHLHAWLITKVQYHEARQQGDKPHVTVHAVSNGGTGSGRRGEGGALGVISNSWTFHGDAVTRKRVSDILTAQRIYVETSALREEYERNLDHYREVMGGFAEQFYYAGQPLSGNESYRTPAPRERVKVIHDLPSHETVAPADYVESVLFMDPAKVDGTGRRRKMSGEPVTAEQADVDEEWPGIGSVPVQFVVRCFDLSTHEFMWVNAVDMKRYVYDPSLGEKIVLPADQRNLLDILTSDLDDFTGDVIEGKSTGNVVLAKGKPGVGKTLTAEVYSELIERPLYSIHSGNLGVQADEVRKNLEVTFQRAKRWNAVLLLDEADVFVLERGNNITQNAIVAEFLRTLEYFDGLLFMTTNRADNIDDAILSRAAAIIDYEMPDIEGIRAVWEVQARNQSATIDPDVLDDLVEGFEEISPRDVKMLLRLALRYAKGNDVPLDTEVFAKCAMFRGLHFDKGSRVRLVERRSR